MIVDINEYSFPPGDEDGVIATVREGVIPAASQHAGFKVGIWVLDRESSKVVNMLIFESDDALAEAMATSREELGTTMYDRTSATYTKGHREYELIGFTVGSPEGR